MCLLLFCKWCGFSLSAFFFLFQNALERTWNAGTIHWETVNRCKFLHVREGNINTLEQVYENIHNIKSLGANRGARTGYNRSIQKIYSYTLKLSGWLPSC